MFDKEFDLTAYLSKRTENLHNNQNKNDLAVETFETLDEQWISAKAQIPMQRHTEIENLVNDKCRYIDAVPMICAHSDAGKTTLCRKYPKMFQDVDDYLLDSRIYDGKIWKLLSDTPSPWGFIVGGSGIGKTHIIKTLGLKTIRLGGRTRELVDIDDLLPKMLKYCTDQHQADLLRDNIRNAEADALIKLWLPWVIDQDQVVFLHNFDEVPVGGEVLAAASFPVIKWYAGDPADCPISTPKDKWHSKADVMHDRRINCHYDMTEICYSRADVEDWCLNSLGLRVKFEKHNFNNQFRAERIDQVRWDNPTPDAGAWSLFEQVKIATIWPKLQADIEAEVFSKESKVLLVHVPREIKALSGLGLGSVAYMGKLSKPNAESGRRSQLDDHSMKGLPVHKKWTRDGMERQFLDLHRNYKREVRNRQSWFWLFKKQKMRDGIIKTWDEQTILYLTSELKDWERYQEENYEDILFQNYHMPDWLYKLKRYRSGKWDLHLGPANDCAQVMRMVDEQTYGWILLLTKEFDLTRKSFIKGMKALSAMVKAFNNDWRSDWKRLAELAHLTPFTRYFDKQEQADDVRSWLCSQEKSKHYVDGSEARFLEEFRTSVREILTQKVSHAEHTFEEFVGMPHLWAVSGSARSDLQPGTVVVDGKPVKLRNSKRAVAYFNSTDSILEYCRRDVSENYVFLKKEEVNRIRTIVNSSLNMYLHMSYLDQYVYDMVDPIFQQASPIFKKFDYVRDKIDQARRIGSWVNMPLDQKGFERQTSFPMLDVIMDVIEDLLPDSLKPNLAKVRQLVHSSTLHFTEDGEVLIDGEQITNGVSSGWKWTALFNTLVNLAEWVTCARLNGLEYRNLCALGDDTRVQVKTYQDAKTALNWYQKAKIEINTKVAIVSHTCDEFLRVVTEPGLSGGYYTRVLPSICFRKPGSQQPSTPIEEIEVIMNNWLKLMSRSQVDLESAMVYDINNSLGRFDIKVDASEFIHTPKLLNGFGLVPFKVGGKGITIDKIHKLQHNPMSVRMNKVRIAAQRKAGLTRDRIVEVDRQWLGSFFSENIDYNIVGYKVEPADNNILDLRSSAEAEVKLHLFMMDLIDGLNHFDKYLPYRKGQFVPVSKLHGSGFFNNTYDALSPVDKHVIFENPEVFERLRKQLGLHVVSKMAKEGAQWMDIKQKRFDVDFASTIGAQVWCFWLDKNLIKHMSFNAVTVWIGKWLTHYLERLVFKQYS